MQKEIFEKMKKIDVETVVYTYYDERTCNT